MLKASVLLLILTSDALAHGSSHPRWHVYKDARGVEYAICRDQTYSEAKELVFQNYIKVCPHWYSPCNLEYQDSYYIVYPKYSSTYRAGARC